MPTNTISIGTAGGANLISKSIVIAAEQSQSYEFTVLAAAPADFQVAMVLTVALMKSIYIVSDQDILLETNAIDGAGGNVLSLIANEPYVWWSSALHANILTADVLTSFWTNASGLDANVKIEIVVDPTV